MVGFPRLLLFAVLEDNAAEGFQTQMCNRIVVESSGGMNV